MSESRGTFTDEILEISGTPMWNRLHKKSKPPKQLLQEVTQSYTLFMSRIERKYCLVSTSYLAGLFEIIILLIFDRIACVLVTFYHFVMPIIRRRNLNLISVQSWEYLKHSETFPFRKFCLPFAHITYAMGQLVSSFQWQPTRPKYLLRVD